MDNLLLFEDLGSEGHHLRREGYVNYDIPLLGKLLNEVDSILLLFKVTPTQLLAKHIQPSLISDDSSNPLHQHHYLDVDIADINSGRVLSSILTARNGEPVAVMVFGHAIAEGIDENVAT